ncbi:MAG: phosphatase PAP2 family protein, partial [Dehalococcoidia bacterium]
MSNSSGALAQYGSRSDNQDPARGRLAGAGIPLVFGVLMAVILGLSLAAHQYERFPGDLPIANWVQSISLPLLGGTMEVISALGTWTWAVPATSVVVVLLWLLKKRADAVYIIVITLGSTGINRLVKEIVDRPRPSADLVEVAQEVSTKSFPSGHVLYAATFYGLMLSYCYFSQFRPRWVMLVIQVVLAVLILAMGFSRVYLGVHWPSDVIGGYVLGGLFV